MADDTQKNADFIDRVVSDAKNPPETRMLTGWFGNSGEDGYRRLYADAELSSYVDIPDDAILYTEPLRDSQPAGCVMVWIKRDAALKQGGSAASRAARFLQGQVQQDFASAGAAGSLDKAGLRCITEVPCGEPTGFTGRCTKQPDVGGAWPCITAVPHCYEVTGFTGKCTHAPWPNPTRYVGCTILHCPTNDLTHIPHICNIVASGQPGCVVVNPPQGGDPEKKVAAADAEERAIPATEIPGCGYTKSWGVCETHLLGCNPAAQGNADPALIQDAGAPASLACASIACHFTQICYTRNIGHCYSIPCQLPTAICTRFQKGCIPVNSPFCPFPPETPFGPGGGGTPVQQGGNFAAFGAAANPVDPARIRPVNPGNTFLIPCSPSVIDVCPSQGPECPSAIDGCPTRINCNTQPPTGFCTQLPEACQTNCGPQCQTQQLNCTQVACTQAGPQCPTPQLDCTFTVTLGGPACPTPNCPVTGPVTIQAVGAQAFAAAAQRPAPQTQFAGCPASDFVACSQFGGCPTLPKGDCTFFGCPSLPQYGAAGPGGGCTQSGPQCPTHAKPQCTFTGPACPPTPGIICTQLATCKTHQFPCPSQQFECTMFCTQGAPGCPQTINSPACAGPITVSGQQCPVHTGFNCPSAIGCQSVACQSVACQPQGGERQFAFAQQAYGGPQTAATVCTQLNCPNTLATICTQTGPQCPPHPTGGIDCTAVTCTHIGPQCPITRGPAICTQLGPQCPHTAGCPSPGIDCTVILCTKIGPQCPNTAATVCTQSGPQCPPPHTQLCPITTGGPQCPPASGFNCPSQFGCQSIACGQTNACVSAGCQPGGGGQRELAARTGVNCTNLYCQYETQAAGCTHFPCNAYTMAWVCNYPN